MTTPDPQVRGSALTTTLASLLGWIELGLLCFSAGMLLVVLTRVAPSTPAFVGLLAVAVVLLVLVGVLELLRRRVRH